MKSCRGWRAHKERGPRQLLGLPNQPVQPEKEFFFNLNKRKIFLLLGIFMENRRHTFESRPFLLCQGTSAEAYFGFSIEKGKKNGSKSYKTYQRYQRRGKGSYGLNEGKNWPQSVLS